VPSTHRSATKKSGSGVEAREGIDTLVVSRGSKANDSLYKALKGRVKELHVVGQALAPRKMLDSALDGLRVGRMVSGERSLGGVMSPSERSGMERTKKGEARAIFAPP
jgi:hypothetical protein